MGRGGAGASVRLGFFIRERGSRRERSETLAPHAGLPEFDLWLAAHVSATAVSLDHRRRCARNARSLEPASWAVTAASPFGVFEPHHSVFEATLDRRLASRADESPHTGLLTAPCDATGRVTHWRENRSKYRCA